MNESINLYQQNKMRVSLNKGTANIKKKQNQIKKYRPLFERKDIATNFELVQFITKTKIWYCIKYNTE